MLTLYLSMVESEEDADKVTYIYENFYSLMAYSAGKVLNHNKHDVEDVVHSSMMKIIENIRLIDFSDMNRAKNFCMTVAKNKAKDYCKRKDNRSLPLDEVFSENIEKECDPVEMIITRESYNIIVRAIESLDEKYRDVCMLKYLHGLKEREIAELLDISPKTVGTRIFRGKQLLREALREENTYEQ